MWIYATIERNVTLSCLRCLGDHPDISTPLEENL